jgi:hypothetical protein
LGGSILSFNLAWAQPISPITGLPEPEKGLGNYVLVRATNSLPKFDLDFAGGTPKDLVKAIEKATNKPLNAIIPDDCSVLKISPISLFSAALNYRQNYRIPSTYPPAVYKLSQNSSSLG